MWTTTIRPKKFKRYPIEYFQIGISEVRTAEGKLYMFVAVEHNSKLAVAELHEKAPKRVAAEFLDRLIEAVPYKIHPVKFQAQSDLSNAGTKHLIGALPQNRKTRHLYEIAGFLFGCGSLITPRL